MRMMRTMFLVVVGMAALTACKQGGEEKPNARESAISAAQSGESTHEQGVAVASGEERSAVAAECRVELAVTGMTCAAGCSPVVMSALESVDGVAQVEVDFASKHAAVSAAGTLCSADGAGQLLDALRAKKYDGTVEQITSLTGG